MTLDEQIRAKLQQQRTRWVARHYGELLGATWPDLKQAQTAYRLSDLGACHQAIRAALDLGLLRVDMAIAKALNIPPEEAE